MPNKQGQTQQQSQVMVQRQKLTQQQLLVVRLTELPIAGLEEKVKNELDENYALEEGRRDDYDDENLGESGSDTEYDVNTDDSSSGEYSRDEMLESMGMGDNHSDYSSDDVPIYFANRGDMNVEVPIGDTGSFIEDLEAQIGDYEVDDTMRQMLVYLIGSLDSRGFIDKSLDELADDMAIYQNLDVEEKDVERALHLLQKFDPPGIGARDLRECLLIQIDRIIAQQMRTAVGGDSQKNSLLELERKVVSDYYQAFVHKNFDKIMDGLGISASEMKTVQEAIAHLNPKPGRALNESSSDKVMTVIPDFIIETDENENQIQMWLNEGNIPPLHISRDYVDEMRRYENRRKTLSSEEKEAYAFTKKNVDEAKMFIDAINQRRHTLYVTMKAIIELQREFFFTQDDDQLKPMILQDVATKANLDISTVSRVCNSKYAIVDGNVYSLKYFFERQRSNADGEDINIREVKREIQALVDAEDKQNPLSDEAITQMLNNKGFNIKRRTVAKYRDQMNLPKAKLRKEITS